MPKKPALAKAGVGTGFRKTSRSIKKLEREDDSKRCHPDLASSCRSTAGTTSLEAPAAFVDHALTIKLVRSGVATLE